MDGYRRYAIYAAPKGALWDWASGWLGWNAATWAESPHPELSGLPCSVAELTGTPRKYGFHATIKPPFHLARGAVAQDLHWAMEALALRLSPVTLDGLRLDGMGGRFLALVPDGDTADLMQLAATVVEALDAFRAPPDASEIARRNPDALTEQERGHLERWGYPYVFDTFRFHMTLTGELDDARIGAVEAVLAPALAPLLPTPYLIDNLCLFGEGPDGRFRILHRYALSG